MQIQRSLPSVFAAVVAAGALCLALPAPGQEAAQEPEDTSRVEVSVPDAEPKRTVIEVERVSLPAATGAADHPYTVAVPEDWSVHRPVGAPGIFLGPPDADLATTPEMLMVRESDVDLSDPDEVLRNLRTNAEAGEWTLLEGEVRDFGGVRGLWIVRRLPAQEGRFPERYNLAVKLPLEEGSLDVLATLPTMLYDGVRERLVKYMLSSIEPAGGAEE